MKIVHKQRVAIKIGEMRFGLCFFNESGNLYMVTDEKDDVTGSRTVVRLETGRLVQMSCDDVAVPVHLVTVEVE